MTVIIKIEVINGILYQWDNGRQIRIISPDEAVSEVHFANLNDKEALVVGPKEIDGVIVCDIPNILLQSGAGIIVYIMNCSEEIERTIAYRQLYVSNRQKPKNYVYTETEVKSYTTLEKRIEILEKSGGVSDEKIENVVKEYLDKNPVAVGATAEQAAQIEKNKQDISKISEQINDSIFEGLTASFYGDSLTEQNYHYTKGYHKWIGELLKLKSYNNYGHSGHTTANVCGEINAIEDTSDIIFVMCGVNDQTRSTPLGIFGDNTTSTTYGSYDVLCSTLKEKYPTKLIVFITPHYQTRYPHNSGITSYEVSKAMKEVCEKYAIPVYDNFVLSGIYPSNLSYYTTDKCHWNDLAHEMVGKNIAKWVIDTFRYLYLGEVEITKTLNSISAVYNQGENVIYTTNTLNDLKQYLTITANYSDNTSSIVQSYTLSGEIVEGSNIITVSYRDKTTTFVVSAEKKEVTLSMTTVGCSAEYSQNTLTISDLTQNFVAVEFDNVSSIVIDGDKTISDSTEILGWIGFKTNDGYYTIGNESFKFELESLTPTKIGTGENFRYGLTTLAITNGVGTVSKDGKVVFTIENAEKIVYISSAARENTVVLTPIV